MNRPETFTPWRAEGKKGSRLKAVQISLLDKYTSLSCLPAPPVCVSVCVCAHTRVCVRARASACISVKAAGFLVSKNLQVPERRHRSVDWERGLRCAASGTEPPPLPGTWPLRGLPVFTLKSASTHRHSAITSPWRRASMRRG